MFLILYSRFALVLVRSLRSVSNCGEKSRKKNTKKVCGQAKMDKNSVINVMSWNCTANITRKSSFPGKEKSIIEVQGLKLPIFFIS